MIRERMFEDSGMMRIVRQQEVTPHLESAAGMRENQRQGADLRHVGTVPLVIAEQWAKECGAVVGSHEFAEYVKRKLMNGEFSKFATGRF